ncbi:Ig-like domain (group 2) [Xylanibacter ruminicola]|uniref:Ig-like domain (Group 2) n=1 Tax=Xylanibacter ruminicola TaxID=839 RepID=A0A1H5WCJ7_XYLRU|nr:Ig-like domain-containing protein [Xylanibacter ruminicola]SEF97184.1 Ig-like domain (group 2) [Xylanibacter ruminicola]
MKKTFRFTGFILISIVSCSFLSCSSDSDENPLIVTPASISMHYEDTQQLQAEGATSWLSSDEFVAKVSSTGLVTANHVGKTEIIVSNGKKNTTCEVTVTPEYNLYDDPILQWGASMSTIQSLETHKKLSSSSSDVISYDYSFGNNPCAMGYSFENGKLKAVMAMLDYSLYLKTGYYLLERYQPAAETDDYDFLFVDALSKDKCKTAVYFTTQKSGRNTYTVIMYMDFSKLSSSTRSVIGYNSEMMKMLQEVARILENQ